MSVVAARVYKDRIVIAADSILVKGWSKRTSGMSKLVEINDMIMGGTGYAEETSLLQKFMETHKPLSATEREVVNFIVEFSRWKRDFSGDGAIQNTYLLVFDGHLFSIEGVFVSEVKDFVAIGAGEDFACAALYLGHTPKEAVKVACELSCLVSEPIIYFEQETTK